MKREIKCPKCGSNHIRRIEDEDDFLPYKAPEVLEKNVRKSKTKTKQPYFCLEEGCGHKWEEDLNSNF